MIRKRLVSRSMLVVAVALSVASCGGGGAHDAVQEPLGQAAPPGTHTAGQREAPARTESPTSTAETTNRPADTVPATTTTAPGAATVRESTPLDLPGPDAGPDRPKGLSAAEWWDTMLGGDVTDPVAVAPMLANPANSDLDTTVAQQVAKIGRDVVLAELTGSNQHLWPTYFGAVAGSPPQPTIGVTINGVSAGRNPLDAGYVRVLAIWSAKWSPSVRHEVQGQKTVVLFRWNAMAKKFEPVTCYEVPGGC